MVSMTEVRDRIERRVTVDGECRVWRGATFNANGSPRIVVDGRDRPVRAVVFSLFTGIDAPPGARIGMKAVCANPGKCVAFRHIDTDSLDARRVMFDFTRVECDGCGTARGVFSFLAGEARCGGCGARMVSTGEAR